MSGWNLPPGVTNQMIDDAQTDHIEDCTTEHCLRTVDGRTSAYRREAYPDGSFSLIWEGYRPARKAARGKR